jgi:hypothetical protein
VIFPQSLRHGKGPPLSVATRKNNEYFSGTGMVSILVPDPAWIGLQLFRLMPLLGGNGVARPFLRFADEIGAQ